MSVKCDRIDGAVVWESVMAKRGHLTHLWFKR